MISVFFNSSGYYITGENIESTSRFSPALSSDGQKIFQDIHHTYMVLVRALRELKNTAGSQDIVFYNDSRIIDEINGILEPQDEVCSAFIKTIRRNIIPSMISIILFRKKASDFIALRIRQAHSTMMSSVDRSKLVELEKRNREDRCLQFKQGALRKLKDRWSK